MSYYIDRGPLADALFAITGMEPPKYTHGLYLSESLEDKAVDLQDWCADNARPSWATGLGVLEAAELLVQQAVENANIPPEKV